MAKLTDSYIKYIVLNQYPNSKIIDIYRVLTKSSSRIYVVMNAMLTLTILKKVEGVKSVG